MSQVKDLVDAIDAFIVGCKDDAIWDAIKECCIMAAWDGLSGCLVPLKGTAPTNNNFVSGDYDRETGLVGDGATKYLDSNRASNDDPQNNAHLALYVTSASANVYAGAVDTSGSPTKLTQIFGYVGGSVSINSATNNFVGNFDLQTGFIAGSRENATQIKYRIAGTTTTAASNSVTPNSLNIYIFARNYTPSSPTAARFAFYSIGESLDLALLDSRVSTLMTAIGAAIP